MRCIITGDINMNPRPWPSTIMINNQMRPIMSHASLPNNKYPHLDDDIRRLVIRCCAVEPQRRPSLESLYREVHEYLGSRRSAYYRELPGGHMETNENVKREVSRYLYDADGT